MISIDRAQTVLFVLAMVSLLGIAVCVFFGVDELALTGGFAFGWLVGIFQAVNHTIIDVCEKR